MFTFWSCYETYYVQIIEFKEPRISWREKNWALESNYVKKTLWLVCPPQAKNKNWVSPPYPELRL